MPEPRQALFMQDSAPPHSAKKTQDWCRENLPSWTNCPVAEGLSLRRLALFDLHPSSSRGLVGQPLWSEGHYHCPLI